MYPDWISRALFGQEWKQREKDGTYGEFVDAWIALTEEEREVCGVFKSFEPANNHVVCL